MLHADSRYRLWYGSGAGMCYAESDDGIDWRKPELNLVEYDGSTANNIVLPAGSRIRPGQIFIDPAAPAEERYKMVLNGEASRPTIAVSGDGLQWRALDEPMMVSFRDTSNAACFDAELGKYVG